MRGWERSVENVGEETKLQNFAKFTSKILLILQIKSCKFSSENFIHFQWNPTEIV